MIRFGCVNMMMDSKYSRDVKINETTELHTIFLRILVLTRSLLHM